MKLIRRVFVWVLVSFALQFGILYVADAFYKRGKQEIVLNTNVQTTSPAGKVKFYVKNDNKKIRISDSCKYLVYKEENKLVIKNGKDEIKEIQPDGGEIIYYAWIKNRDTVATMQKKGDRLYLITYDAAHGNQLRAIDVCAFQSDMSVDNIVQSTNINVTYIKIKRGEGNDTIYRININERSEIMQISTKNVGEMDTFPLADRFIYRNNDAGNFGISYLYSVNPDSDEKATDNKVIDVPTDSPNLKLLGVSGNNCLYIGEYEPENENRIIRIYYKSMTNAQPEEWTDWETKDFSGEEPGNRPKENEIYFNGAGDILVNDNLNGEIKNLMTGDTTQYTGAFYFITEDYVVSTESGVEDGELQYVKIQKAKK